MLTKSEVKGSIGNRVQEKAGYLDSTDEGVNFKGCVKRPLGDARKRNLNFLWSKMGDCE